MNSTLTQDGWLVDPINPPSILSDAPPMAEKLSAAPGAASLASRGDHQHPRLTSSTRVTLNASGVATVNYTRTFVTKPALVLTALNPSGRAVQLEQTSDIFDGTNYTGCTIKGYRSQTLPDLTGIVLLGALVAALSQFDPLGGSASGVEVSVIAIQPSN